MNIVLLAFGDNLLYHIQAYFCILSLLKYRNEGDTIMLYTDAPKYYNRYKDYITIIELSESIIKEWMKDYNYLFRIKLKVMEDSAIHHPNKHLMFIDCDTVVTNPLSHIKDLLDKGTGIMYNDEGHPSKMKGASLAMWKALKGKVIDNCIISEQHNVWNSGVVGIPQTHVSEVIELAIHVCDYILESGVKCFTAEQYALSVAMTEYCEIVSIDKYIIHYWGNKDEWTSLIITFMCNSFLKNKTVNQEIKALAKVDVDDLPLRVKKSHTLQMILKVMSVLFPDKIE